MSYQQFDPVELRMPTCGWVDGAVIQDEWWVATVARVQDRGVVVLATPPGKLVPVYVPIAIDQVSHLLRRPRRDIRDAPEALPRD